MRQISVLLLTQDHKKRYIGSATTKKSSVEALCGTVPRCKGPGRQQREKGGTAEANGRFPPAVCWAVVKNAADCHFFVERYRALVTTCFAEGHGNCRGLLLYILLGGRT